MFLVTKLLFMHVILLLQYSPTVSLCARDAGLLPTSSNTTWAAERKTPQAHASDLLDCGAVYTPSSVPSSSLGVATPYVALVYTQHSLSPSNSSQVVTTKLGAIKVLHTLECACERGDLYIHTTQTTFLLYTSLLVDWWRSRLVSRTRHHHRHHSDYASHPATAISFSILPTRTWTLKAAEGFTARGFAHRKSSIGHHLEVAETQARRPWAIFSSLLPDYCRA